MRPDIRIVDVSDQPQYLLGHVPGAVHAYWEDLVERNSPTYGRLAGRPDREKVFGNLGIDQKTLVIVYDRNDNRAAARFAWALWYAGHPNVRILNGGLAGWAASGYAIETKTHTAPRVFYRDLPDESLLINRCDMSKAITDPQSVILDVRTDDEMKQTWDNTTQIGSIPNARRLPWTAFIREPKVPAFRSPDDLRAMLAGVGATPDRTIDHLRHLQQRRRTPLLRPQGARLRPRQALRWRLGRMGRQPVARAVVATVRLIDTTRSNE